LGLDYFKKKRYPGQLSFVVQQSVRLVKDVLKNFPQIKILYNNQLVNEQIAFLKGSILNTGIIDIDDSKIRKPLSILLPDGCKWLSA
jgi:hypothetical protein